MIAIKGIEEMPSCCVTYTAENDNYVGCPLYKICKQRETIKTNYKPDNCPLVEITTCKDCKYWNFYENRSILCGYCSHLETETGEDFFCADGERRIRN